MQGPILREALEDTLEVDPTINSNMNTEDKETVASLTMAIPLPHLLLSIPTLILSITPNPAFRMQGRAQISGELHSKSFRGFLPK
ncbi:hypothetical protein TWF281_006636 [Arthrobotrys megalospora]